MAFVGERIPESDKNIIDMKKLWSTSSYFIEPTRWAADRELDVYLFPLGGGGAEMPSFFGISIQGEIVTFEADRWGTGNNKTGIVLSYKVLRMTVPQTLEARREEIKKLICEALDAYGQYGDRSHVTLVSVEFVKRRD
jgi:hypothetical protein